MQRREDYGTDGNNGTHGKLLTKPIPLVSLVRLFRYFCLFRNLSLHSHYLFTEKML